MAEDVQAIKLPFESGEYLVTWDVPGGDSGLLQIPGLLTVERDKYPHSVLYGDMPIEWVTEGAAGVASFPQSSSFEALTGRLSTGAYVCLANGQLNYWFNTQGRAVAAFAVLSQDPFRPDEHRKYNSIEIQIEGLESLTGIAPIHRVKMPMKAGETEWLAELRPESTVEWKRDGKTMSFRYDHSARVMDGYEFRLAFGPALRLASETPMSIADWWLEWVRPLVQLVSTVTGGPRELRYFLADSGDAQSRRTQDQVFGWNITHVPVNSTRASVDEIRSSIRLVDDEMSLLDLIVAWQERLRDHHPLFETYGVMATAGEQHPRSRFLLLIQALEGSYGFEHSEQHEEDAARYGEKRLQVLLRATEALDAVDLKFIRKHLRRAPQEGLASALAELLSRLPADFVEQLNKTALAAKVRDSDERTPALPLQAVLTRARNTLSHGSGSFHTADLAVVADLLEAVVRSEAVRLLNAPSSAQERALKAAD